jgi:diglucosylglycerate octanoyltransferase
VTIAGDAKPATAGGVKAADRTLLVIADSLAFHGPERGELLTHPGLFPNVAAAALTEAGCGPVRAEIVARRGWTARDAWEALTRDPRVYSFLLPDADGVLLAVGGMDYLPAVLPTHLREGIRYLRPPVVRRAARRAYLAAQPLGARLTRGRWRSLPQRLTDGYLSRCVYGIRYYHPGTPIFGVLPPPHSAPLYGRVIDGHGAAVDAARRWGQREGVPMVDLPAAVWPHLTAGEGNPDGMHWGWAGHTAAGIAIADVVRAHPDWPRRRRDAQARG